MRSGRRKTTMEDGDKSIETMVHDDHTEPDLQHAIFQRLEEWHDNKPHQPVHTANRLLREAVQ